MNKFYGLFLALFCFNSLWAQKVDSLITPPKDVLEENSELQNLIENILQDSEEEEFNFDTQFEYLEIYAQNPLDINTVQEAQLVELGLLSDLQIKGLLNYRRIYGQIYSFYELVNVPAWDRITIVKVLPYFTVAPQKAEEAFSFKRAFKYGRHTIFGRYTRVLEKQKGYTDITENDRSTTRYLGSPDQLYLRYRMKYKDRMSLGVTMEKDAGEEFFKGSNKQGFDFYSAHFYVKNPVKHVTAAIVGDYQIYFGQGLMMWSGFGFRKSPAVMNVKRIANTIRPYSSVNEINYLRGAAISTEFGKRNKWESTAFVSYRKRDASIAALDTLDDELFEYGDVSEVSSLQITGMHRTPSEIANENAIGVFTVGANLKYKGDNWHIAWNNAFVSLSAPLQRARGLYQNYLFSGSSLFNSSLDYSYHYKTVQFFGETAMSQNGGIATLNGILLPLDSKVSFAALYRYYGRNYQQMYGNAFGERIGVNNEKGLYIGMEINPIPGLKISTYGDLYKMPWMTSTTDYPMTGFEGFVKAEYNISRKWNFHIQAKSETKGRNNSDYNGYFEQMAPNTKQSLRFHGNFFVSPQFDLRTRVEFSRYKIAATTGNTTSNGFLMYQDITYKPKFAPLKLQLRFAVFQTDDYNARIYAYENDVLYSFSIPAYYGRGFRWYLNTSYNITRDLTIWFRIAQTHYNDRELISSGLNEIKGNKRTDVRVQVRYQF